MIAIQLATTWPNRDSRRSFSAGSPEQSNLLGVFAHPHQAEAEIGFVALLLEVQRDQPRPIRWVSTVPIKA